VSICCGPDPFHNATQNTFRPYKKEPGCQIQRQRTYEEYKYIAKYKLGENFLPRHSRKDSVHIYFSTNLHCNYEYQKYEIKIAIQVTPKYNIPTVSLSNLSKQKIQDIQE
jgi:hypothetical protein